MSHDPIQPEDIVAQGLHGALEHWMVGEADRLGRKSVAGSPQSLIPPLGAAASEILGTAAQPPEDLPAQRLPQPAQRHLRLWLSPEEAYELETISHIVRSLRWITHPVLFICHGNSQGIVHEFVVHQHNAPMVRTAIQAALPQTFVTESADGILAESLQQHGMPVELRTLYPPQPYWGAFEERGPDIHALYRALMDLREDEYAAYQVVFVPVPAPWCSVMRTMATTEVVTAERMKTPRRWNFSPEAEKLVSAKFEDTVFAASMRLGLVSVGDTRSAELWQSLLLVFARLWFSGSPLEFFTERDLADAGVSPQHITQLFLDGASYHHGILVSPRELASFLKFPAQEALRSSSYALDCVPDAVADLSKGPGIVLGEHAVFDRIMPVFWPTEKRAQHMLVTGMTGYGKTFFIAQTAVHIATGEPGGMREGLAFIDPHHTAIERFLQLAPEDRLADCIYHDPIDEEFVLCMPLFSCPDPGAIDTAVSNVTRQIGTLYSKADTGFNIEKGIRSVVRTLFQSEELTFLDALVLTRPDYRGAELREKVCSSLTDEQLLDYWENEFACLDNGSISRIRSRIGYLLEPRRLRPLLANRVVKLTYADVVDQNKIFLANLSAGAGGHHLTNVLGTLHHTGFETAAYARKASSNRPTFTIIADEFGNYCNPRTVSHGLRTLRKFDVSEILSTQNISALPEEVREAMGNVDAHVVFKQGWDDAHYYFKAFGGAVPVNNFLMQSVGQGYVRIGSQVSSLRCPNPAPLRTSAVLEEIKHQTRQRYCIPKTELRERLLDERRASLDELKALDVL